MANKQIQDSIQRRLTDYLAYEVFLRISDVLHNEGFDYTNLGCLGTAVTAGKLLGISPLQLSHCISMAIVPNNILRQVRLVDSSMWKAMATGYAGRAGMFAALLARAGMEGPHLPFEGKAGWCAHVARECFSLNIMGDSRTPFKILDTRTKHRSSSGATISSILAAEKVAPGAQEHRGLAVQKNDVQIVEKFRMLTEDVMGTKRVNDILDRLWNLEDMQNVAAIPSGFVLG